MAHDHHGTHATQHREYSKDVDMLRNRAARLGEPEVTGDRWWPHQTFKAADLLEEGATLTSYERWLAEREVARRERRAQMPSIIRRERLQFEPTRAPGVFVGYIVSPNLNQEAPTHTVEILHLAPGARTIASREYESLYHVLSGRGYSTIYDQRHDWGPHDSIHVPEGAWYQHVNEGSEPVNLLTARVTPLMEHLYSMARVYKGDSFSDLPDDYKPEHPFTKERVAVPYVGGMKWMSHMQMAVHEERADRHRRSLEGRKVLRADEAVIERSEHQGDWKVTLVDRFLGFENRILGMYIHQLPPACHTETHKHGQATIYVLSGRGYSIVDGERHDWQAGDLINVPAGFWHQHFNLDEERVSQHLLISTQPLGWLIHLSKGEFEERGAELPQLSLNGYQPTTEWWK